MLYCTSIITIIIIFAGGFHSATDADSMTPDGHTEEGWFFTWTQAELDRALGPEDGRSAGIAWGVTPTGSLS